MAAFNTKALPFGPVRNSELFANHWLERRLPLEPEWTERREEARTCLDRIAELWREQEELAPQYGAEPTLEEAWIQPVLEALGWPLIYQTFVKGREPDYALFLDKAARTAAVKAGRKEPAFWKHPTIVADAKAWHVSLDHREKGVKREYPPEQIEWYMNQTALDWGLLTNGQLWRLIPRKLSRSQPRFETFLELDLPLLLKRWRGKGAGIRIARQEHILEEFLPWYLLATPGAFLPYKGEVPLIERARTGSTAYRLRVGEELRGQVFEALRLSIEGFLSHAPNKLDPARDLEPARENSFTLLFRLLFILFAEDRQLLPYKTHPTYTNNRSLTHQHNELIAQVEGGILLPSGTGVWRYWSDLFDLIDRGHATYGVPSYNGGLFDRAAHPFLTANALPDPYAARVLDSLRRAIDPDSGDRVSVDYRDLAIQNLGNIYEALLELRPRYASQDMIVVAKRDGAKSIEKTIPADAEPEEGFKPTAATLKPGEVYLETDKGERRASGSYYTPDQIVSYIVENTLGPLCKEIGDALSAEIAALETDRKTARNGKREAIEKDLARLRAEYDDRVLRLAVLDPAMGSGHFLLSACQYLAAEIATNPHTADPDEPAEGTGDAPTLLFWKRRVIERCIYGVDKNPIAVELAKLALWLETVAVDQPLSFLDHHLRHGDSLIGARFDQLGRLHDPNLGTMTLPAQTLEGALPSLLKPLEDIRRMPSATIAQVKEKEHLYHDAFEDVRRPFARLADVWISILITPNDGPEVTPDQYADAIKALGQTKFKAIEKADWFTRAVARATAPGIDAFHWEFEFPEVFLSPERKAHPGFDAIIGNPPWGRAPALDRFRFMPHLTHATEDHAECFMGLSATLIRDGGRFGLVLPDTVLGPNKSPIRRFLLENSGTSYCYNIGPDWFGSDVRMATVLWGARGGRPAGNGAFSTCILPIEIRRKCQPPSDLPLAAAIPGVVRSVKTSDCLADDEVSIPLFGDTTIIAALDKAFGAGITIEAACDRGRGVELNKAGEAFQCPACQRWGAPPNLERSGEFRPKTCAHCGHTYRIARGTRPRVLVEPTHPRERGWTRYIDGDAIHRYTPARHQHIDTTADGINYKPATLYQSPKVLIRQAGIGLNAILDASEAYCPQSVYIYRVRHEYDRTGFDEKLLLAILCSRLFQLQVFAAFAEIDSTRAFAKLTHARLARLRVPNPDLWERSPKIAHHVRICANALTLRGLIGNEDLDWEIEACLLRLGGLDETDFRAMIRAFSRVHENETLLGLFPGGVTGREQHWVTTWLAAVDRCKAVFSD